MFFLCDNLHQNLSNFFDQIEEQLMRLQTVQLLFVLIQKTKNRQNQAEVNIQF